MEISLKQSKRKGADTNSSVSCKFDADIGCCTAAKMENANYPSIDILGSTGSVGEQAIDVARQKNIKVVSICANSNYKRVEQQAREFKPAFCAMADEGAAMQLRASLADTNIRVFGGALGICEAIATSKAQISINSILGEAGLLPTLEIIKQKKKLALANKESLVVAGDIVMKKAAEQGVEIVPVDSEHCAIYQCLMAGRAEDVKKLIITASGGPFFGYNRERLKGITLEDTLAHPTWKMGAKITTDSATLMNKGFEVIEASHLFGVSADKIDVVVHPESIIHSMVEYIDNSVIAQMSVPDMRFCVQFAITSPVRDFGIINELDLVKLAKLSFYKPDEETFILLDYAKRALKMGGAVPAVLNASNEIAVGAFLKRRISFIDIFNIVTKTVDHFASNACKISDFNGILDADKAAREFSKTYIS